MNSPIPAYSTQVTIKDALTIFFEKYGLGADGGMSSNWVKIKFGRFWFPIPNTASRRKALMFHDIHHITTGYESNMKGEAEIGAWEVSTGCGGYWAAWVLDLSAVAMGLLFFPKATYRAFIRGQRTLNLYHHTYTHQQLLDMEVDELKAKMRLDVAFKTDTTPAEVLQFMLWSAVALGLSFVCFVAPYILLGWLLWLKLHS